MKGLSAKGLERGTRLGAEAIRLGLESPSVNRVSHQWMADRGKVHPDLMGAAGLQPAGQEARHRLAVGTTVAFECLANG